MFLTYIWSELYFQNLAIQVLFLGESNHISVGLFLTHYLKSPARRAKNHLTYCLTLGCQGSILGIDLPPNPWLGGQTFQTFTINSQDSEKYSFLNIFQN